MNDTLQEMMREATRLTHSGQLTEATELIQRALRGPNSPATAPTFVAPMLTPAESFVIDGVVLDRSVEAVSPIAKTTNGDEFTGGAHTHAGLTRRYKLYVPPHAEGRSLPLVVMLHGCTQDPDDFAAGTDMNTRARAQGFFVLYPAQSQDGNAQRCWNWFARAHQQRGSGEPEFLADLTRSVIQQHGIDPRRVYVAGLSAGGAMADIVAAAYPEIYAAVGVHSGLPRGAASNVAGAFAAMKNGVSAPRSTAKTSDSRVPVVAFHGDADQTVHPHNGEQVIAARLRNVTSSEPSVEQGVARGGRGFARSVYRDDKGETVAEYWLVKDAGHAWSGGSASGSYADPKGPDATSEMLRFFFEHPLQTH